MCSALPERWARLAEKTREVAVAYAFHRRLLSTANATERAQLMAAEEPLRRATENLRERERVLGDIEMHCAEVPLTEPEAAPVHEVPVSPVPSEEKS
jgi:precorrin isomerase